MNRINFLRLRVRSYSTGGVPSVGFIGLGQMGFPMSGNLLNKYPHSRFLIYDNVTSVSEEFQAQHGDKAAVEVCSSPADVATKADFLVTMLPSPQIVKAVYMGKNGIFEGAKNGQLCIDSSTIDPDTSREVAKKMAEKKIKAVDAPVSGGILAAQAATLTFMVGAPTDDIFNQVKPVLQAMGKNIVHCGPVGNGQIAKICNNFMLGISMMGISETFNLGKRLGMDEKLLREILNTSSGRCWASEVYPPVPNLLPNVPSSRDYEGGFGISLMQKDMALAMDAAQRSGSTVLLGSVANQMYKHVMNVSGMEKKDFSVVYKWLSEQGKKK
ncbi:NAD binding domain of 6-phosphogluconate dehydrogenase-domain-containing protein [Paraphysoderma sedebokerense]|nr:NAD binding domain of 6-phosphogluconate dehydrogenase-domain-containing protein [Paraphysoderma sedebokerense]